jgi:hypothetical protein
MSFHHGGCSVTGVRTLDLTYQIPNPALFRIRNYFLSAFNHLLGNAVSQGPPQLSAPRIFKHHSLTHDRVYLCISVPPFLGPFKRPLTDALISSFQLVSTTNTNTPPLYVSATSHTAHLCIFSLAGAQFAPCQANP